jgi:hypothetical protein
VTTIPDNPTGVSQMKSLLTQSLEQAVADVRQQALSQLVRELMVCLKKQGFDFDHLILAMVDYADQRPDWQEVVKRLEEASSEVAKANELFK